jgi:putative tricarboxylic transport membrane protein
LSNSPIRGMDSAGGRSSPPARPYWLSLGIIAIGAIWLVGALSLQQTAQYAAIGPGMFVTAIGVALIFLGVLLTFQIARGEEFAPQDAEDAMANAPADTAAFLTAVAAAALPLLTMRQLGFPITATLCFTLVARAFGSRRVLLDLAIGAVLSIAAYFSFAALGVTLGGFFPLLGR